jgi:hypothetical protein
MFCRLFNPLRGLDNVLLGDMRCPLGVFARSFEIIFGPFGVFVVALVGNTKEMPIDYLKMYFLKGEHSQGIKSLTERSVGLFLCIKYFSVV